MPAAAGVGIPTKYRNPPTGAMPCTLNRASRQAQQMTNARLTTQAICEIWRASGMSAANKDCTPQVNARIEGAIPKLTISASESNCLPNSVLVPVARATKPSNASNTMAKPMARAAK